MEPTRSAVGLPDPVRIANRAQLISALEVVKGDWSYAQLDDAARSLRTAALGRRTEAPREQDWVPDLLTRGSVSDWIGGRGLPTRNKLFTFLTVCGVPVNQFAAWEQAVDRARRSLPEHTIGEHNPIQLGVHPAIRADATRPGDGDAHDDLPPYVIRHHDHELRGRLREGRGNRLVVLVGGSSVGKTRACYEAALEVLTGWPVIHPPTAVDLLNLLAAGVAPGSVLWLDEMQRYLQSPHGRDVAVALQRLLYRAGGTSDRGHLVVLGTMWLDPYWLDFTRKPQHGKDEQPEVRDLLDRPGVRLTVAEDFNDLSDDQRAQLRRLAAEDPRLAAAIKASGSSARLAQVLAGGPLMLQYYDDLRNVNPAAHAVLTVAMDARRIGYQSPLPRMLLKQAVPGYLSSEGRVANSGWFETALAAATEEIRGVRALTPLRVDPTMGDAEVYELQDFLSERGQRRRRELVPTSLWQALVAHTDQPSDAIRTARSAEARLLYCYALPLLQIAATSGDFDAAIRLANRRHKQDRVAESIEALRSDVGQAQGSSNQRLHELFEERSRAERRLADAGDAAAAVRLAGLLADRGDLAALHERADAGDAAAAVRLAGLLADRGDLAALHERADARDNFAARRLAQLLSSQGDATGARAVLEGVAEAGDPNAVRQLNQMLADEGDLQALRKRANVGDIEAARQLATLGDRSILKKRADAGDLFAIWQMTALLSNRDDTAAAIATLQPSLQASDSEGILWLREMLAKRGDLSGLRESADAGSRRAVDLLAKNGDTSTLQALAERGDTYASFVLASLLLGNDDARGAAILGFAADAHGIREAKLELMGLMTEQNEVPGPKPLARRRVLRKLGVIDSTADEVLADVLAEHGDIERLRHDVHLGLAQSWKLIRLTHEIYGHDTAVYLDRFGLNVDGSITRCFTDYGDYCPQDCRIARTSEFFNPLRYCWATGRST